MKIELKNIICLLIILITSFNCGKSVKNGKNSFFYLLALIGNNKEGTNQTSTNESSPSSLSYSTNSGTSTIITVGVPFNVTPSFTGTITNCTISPSLPSGLSLNPTTCAITGTPTASFAQTIFFITASNQYGSTTASFILSATADPPSNFAIPGGNTQTFTTGVSSTIIPTFTGTITNCTVNPALPLGLVLNPTTCAISGTPSVVSAPQNYTITATNQFGSSSIVLNFGVNTLAPQNLNFASGNSFSINTNTNVNYTPTVTGGITSCVVNPSLPAGLSLNPTTCAITGTPTIGTSNTPYTITASNQYGNTNLVISIATNVITPTNFSYPLPNGVPTIYTIGSPVNVSPAITGLVTNCAVNPSLPAGLTLNTTNCTISGTPTTVSSNTNYTITASNSAGSINSVIQLQINDIPPSNLVYPFGTSTTLAVGTAQSISPTFTGGVTNCSSNPSLPSGLSINTNTCTISGTPNSSVAATNYTITASNAFGSTNVILNITTQLFPPSNLNYPFTSGAVVYTTGISVSATPTVSGIVSNCIVSPSLPAGLNLNNSTCAITGTPTNTTLANNYTITASNASGSTNAIISITINPPAPSNLVYPNSGSLSFPVNIAKTITPSVTGTVSNCTSNPNLPNGLSINANTCAIGGTATSEQTNQSYTITASNAGGTTTANITIIVAQPPLNLTYPTVSNLGYSNGSTMNITPTVSGNGITYSINPALPTGITLNTSTGEISGNYSQDIGSTSAYTITATNSGGTSDVNITLTFFGKLPFKTGQTSCYDASGNVISCAGTGQDGEYQSGRPASVYSGPNQHPTYTNDYTTTDTTTGLVWQSCPTGLSGANCNIGSFNNSYTDDCVYLNSLNGGVGYSGRNDWRYPTTQEIDRFGILYNISPSIQNNFPNQSTRIYNGGSLNRVGKAFSVNLFSTNAFAIQGASCSDQIKPSHAHCGLNLALKCVAGTKIHKEPKTIIINNDYVLDANIGILWRKCAEGVTGADCQTGSPTLMTWTEAINYCKNLNYLGKSWRLPNINEAMTIYLSQSEFTLNPDFPWDNSYTESLWTSTTIEGDYTKAFRVEYPGRDKKLKTETNRVRCVAVP